MEHSMSGGVIKRYEQTTLAKVRVQNEFRWYFCPLPAFEGDEVIVEFDGTETQGVVEEIKYNVTPLSSPAPFSTLKTVLRIIE